MKTTLLFALVAGLVNGRHNHLSTPHAFTFKLDSIPSRQGSLRPERPNDYSFMHAKRLTTVVMQPYRTSAGKEVALPVGVNEETIAVRLGELPLRKGKDYLYIANTNRLLFLSEKVLQSDELLRITYEQLKLAH
jgi:hypothetical protein